MRVVLDACVIYPTVMREVLIGCAEAGLYAPIWSPRIIEEWLRAAGKLGDGARAQAAAEAAGMADRFPDASVIGQPVDGIWLPDDDDVHVLECAIAARADAILTRNVTDFPTRVLAGYGVLRLDPDGFLRGLLDEHPDPVRRVTAHVQERAERISGREQPLRTLMKRTGLPRLGKALAQA